MSRGEEREKEGKEETDDHFKIRAKTRRQKKEKKKMMMKYMVQIYDEQRNSQMTILHGDTVINTAQTSTVIINNGSKNSKCRPKSDTE